MPRLCRTAHDSEFLHSQLEGGSFHCKMCSCAIRVGHNPIALLESFKNLFTFRSLQNVVKCTICRFRRNRFFRRRAGLGNLEIANINSQDRTRRDNYRALDHILKFSYVPRPMIPGQGIHCRRWNRLNHSVHAPGKLLGKVPHQEWNIPLAFPQGRDVHGKNIQAKEEIGPELLLAHHCFQISVRRRNQTRIGPKRARASQPLELPFLQHAEQVGLQFERNLSYFVQKNGAAIGHFESANPLRDRSCERAFLMSKQLAFQQTCRNRRAVELDERLRAPRAQIMNGSRNQFLSCTRVSIDEHGRVCRSDRLHLLQYTPQGSAFSDDLRKIHFAADFVFEIELFLCEPVFQLSNLPKGACILHGNRNLICDLGQKLDIVADERILLIFDHAEYPQHATSTNKGKDGDRTNFGSRGVLHSLPSRLLNATAPGFARAKDRSRDIFIHGDKTLFLDGFVAEGEIHGVDAQVCVVSIGKGNADAVAAHNPARARHYGSEEVPELEIRNHMIGQFKEKSETFVLFHQLLLRGLRRIKMQRVVECESDLLSHYRKKLNFLGGIDTGSLAAKGEGSDFAVGSR